MKNLFVGAIARVQSVLNGLQVKRFLAFTLVGFILLSANGNRVANAYDGNNNKALTDKVLERVHENDSPRPKTTGEWNKEDRETANNPDERGRRISEQTGAALKEFGSGYAEAVKDAGQDAQNSAVRAGEEIADQVRR